MENRPRNRSRNAAPQAPHVTRQQADLPNSSIEPVAISLHKGEEGTKDTVLDRQAKAFDPRMVDVMFIARYYNDSYFPGLMANPAIRSQISRVAESYPYSLKVQYCHWLALSAKLQAGIETHLPMPVIIHPQSDQQSAVSECFKPVLSGQKVLVFSELLSQLLSQDAKDRFAMTQLARRKVRHNVERLTMAYIVLTHRHLEASKMVTLITALFDSFSSPDPPPIPLLRNSPFVNIIIDWLFTARQSWDVEYRWKCIFLLSAAASEPRNRQDQLTTSADDNYVTAKKIGRLHDISQSPYDVEEMFMHLCGSEDVCIPVMGACLLRWIEHRTIEPYFLLQTGEIGLYLVLLGEVTHHHAPLHGRVLRVVSRLLDASNSMTLSPRLWFAIHNELFEHLVRLQHKGFVVPVLEFIRKCHRRGTTDINLIRKVVWNMLLSNPPPFSDEFVHLLLPLVLNEEITQAGGEFDWYLVPLFIAHCLILHKPQWEQQLHGLTDE